MEVHHHSHKPKNWREYITEFVMLFAAVTLGFFAENLREHQVIENHKTQNLMSMINNLRQDSIEIESRIAEYKDAIKHFEIMKDLSLAFNQNKLTEAEYIDSVVDKYLNSKFGIGLFINNASYKNTISSGDLSYIQNNETKSLIAQYYEALYGKLLVNNKVLDEELNEFLNKTFIFGFLEKLDQKLDGQSRSYTNQLEDFKSIPAFKKLLTAPEFRMVVNKFEGRCGYYLYVMETAKELNNKLLLQLTKKEF